MVEGLVSVIMGIYNCSDTLSEAIESIIGQTYTNWELIMCDDASTDDTYQVALRYQKKYPDKIKLIQNEVNSKLPYTLNHCLKYASGEFIARMDADDKSTADRFMVQVRYLREHSDVDLVGTAMQRFNEKGLGAIDEKPQYPDRFTLRKLIPFNHATIMTYKRVYDALGGYTVCERTVRGQDYDLWFRFYHEGYRGDNLKEPLYMVREDEAAFKRRTIKVRWNGFKTACIGYKLLGYPKIWLIKPACDFVIKSLIPTRLMIYYHDLQKKG